MADTMNMATDRQTQQLINSAQVSSNYNTNRSQDFAREQMDFQTNANAKAMAFSSSEAQKNRDFQENLSNTAHQREVVDLIKSGLNPVLSSKYGGSSTPSGSSASGVSSSGASGNVDTGVTNLFNGLIQAVIGQATALTTTSMNNQTALQSTSMNNEISKIISQISANAMLGATSISARSNQYMQDKSQAFDQFMKQNYPQNVTGGISSIVQSMKDAFNGGSANTGKDSSVQNSEISKIISHMNTSLSKESMSNPDNWGYLGKLFKKHN